MVSFLSLLNSYFNGYFIEELFQKMSLLPSSEDIPAGIKTQVEAFALHLAPRALLNDENPAVSRLPLGGPLSSPRALDIHPYPLQSH